MLPVIALTGQTYQAIAPYADRRDLFDDKFTFLPAGWEGDGMTYKRL